MEIPIWDPELCIGCAKCTIVCPHAALRLQVFEPAALEGAPETFPSKPFRSRELPGHRLAIQVAPDDCTGCGVCVQVCPAHRKDDPSYKSLNMRPIEPPRASERANHELFSSIPRLDRTRLSPASLKGSQVLDAESCGWPPLARSALGLLREARELTAWLLRHGTSEREAARSQALSSLAKTPGEGSIPWSPGGSLPRRIPWRGDGGPGTRPYGGGVTPTTARIAPSLLSCDFARLGDEVAALSAAGADRIHWDVMDGCFVPNLTIGPDVVAAARSHTDLPFEAHLMVADPERLLARWVEADCTLVTVHAEACTHLHRTLASISELGARAGVALNPATPVSAVEHVLDLVDLVLVMTVNPGFGGQRYLTSMEAKVAAVAAMVTASGAPAEIQVDGGIAADTIGGAKAAGATTFVTGSALYRHPGGITAALDELRDRAAEDKSDEVTSGERELRAYA